MHPELRAVRALRNARAQVEIAASILPLGPMLPGVLAKALEQASDAYAAKRDAQDKAKMKLRDERRRERGRKPEIAARRMERIASPVLDAWRARILSNRAESRISGDGPRCVDNRESA